MSETYWYDKTSLKRKGGHITVWTKYEPRVYDSLVSIRVLKTSEHFDDQKWMLYSHTLVKSEIDCNEDRIKTITSIDYDENGSPLETYDEQNAAFTSIPPETMSEYLESAICK